MSKQNKKSFRLLFAHFETKKNINHYFLVLKVESWKDSSMDQWLPLTEYATKYKVSVSTLRRRIKAEDIKYLFQDGKYFIYENLVPTISTNVKVNSPSQSYLNSELASPELSTMPSPDHAVESSTEETLESSIKSEDSSFLENLRKTATSKLPQLKNEVGMLYKNKNLKKEFSSAISPSINIEEEYYFKKQKEDRKIVSEFEYVKTETPVPTSENSGIKEFSEKISKIGAKEPILTAANKLLAELKKAYTQILHEKEEQIMTLKEEVSDLKTLVKVLESENNRIKNQWS